MKKILSLILLALLPMVANADPVEIDGIYYNLVSKIKEAEVTERPNRYKGAVNIPDKVTYDGKEYSVTSIEKKAFYYCRDLTAITIPSSLKAIGEDAFYYCYELKKVFVSDIAAWCSISFFNCDSNPLYYTHHLYSDEETEITDIAIPDGVTSIGGYAFIKCSSLTSVNIPNSVTSIGNSAFDGCSGLTSVIIPNSVTSIGDGAFANCSGLTSVTIPESMTSINWGVFEYCTGLTSVTIPNSVTSIGERAFSYCSGLTSLTIPNSITRIEKDVFDHCSSLNNFTIPNSVTSIGEDAFFGCSSLTSITIPESVTSIGNDAFGGCSGLTSVTIPNSITVINCFAGCTSLASITIPNSVTSIGSGAFFDCSGLTSITIPNSVTSIDTDAFFGCSSLTSIIIPNSVTYIGNDAFYCCSSLTSVTIGNSVTSIGSSAFANCPELADVYCYAEEVPKTGSYAFKGSYIEYATLYVPESAIEQYRATEPWSQFGTIKTTDGNIPDPPKPEICATPTISYANGELIFNCETEGVEYISEITDTDIKKYYEKSVSLSATYTITVYAMKDGYENSEVATGTLCWIDVAPQTEGIVNEDAVMEVKAMPVLIQSQGGAISIQGAAEGTPIAVYDAEGKQYGSTIAEKDRATITTSLRPGSIAVVKIGEKSIKVLIK